MAKRKECKWYSVEGCMHRDEHDEPIEGGCPEEFKDDCMYAILSDGVDWDDWMFD